MGQAAAIDYRASSRANRRMMDTTIWDACDILGVDINGARTSDVFHALYMKYYREELAAADGKENGND